jgi:hypothetical protein
MLMMSHAEELETRDVPPAASIDGEFLVDLFRSGANTFSSMMDCVFQYFTASVLRDLQREADLVSLISPYMCTDRKYVLLLRDTVSQSHL